MTDHFAWPLGREFGTGRRLDALDGRKLDIQALRVQKQRFLHIFQRFPNWTETGRKLDGTGRTRPPLRGRPASSLSNQPRVKYDPMANEEGDNMT